MVDAQEEKQVRDLMLKFAQTPCPDSDIVGLFALHLWGIEVSHCKTEASLYNLLQYDIPEDFISGDSISLENLGGCVEAVLREDVVDIEDVEEE